MSKSRFYFADAAAQGYLREIVGLERWQDFVKNCANLFGQLNVALMGVVDGFIQKRRYAYRAASE